MKITEYEKLIHRITIADIDENWLARELTVRLDLIDDIVHSDIDRTDAVEAAHEIVFLYFIVGCRLQRDKRDLDFLRFERIYDLDCRLLWDHSLIDDSLLSIREHRFKERLNQKNRERIHQLLPKTTIADGEFSRFRSMLSFSPKAFVVACSSETSAQMNKLVKFLKQRSKEEGGE